MIYIFYPLYFFRFTVIRIFTLRKPLSSCNNEDGLGENEIIEKSCTKRVLDLRTRLTIFLSADGRKNFEVTFVYVYLYK